MRLRGYSDKTPKPMVEVGHRPILWHVMKYYASFGHKDFILCLGYKADFIKEYFINYSEYVTNDFVLTEGGRNVSLLSSDIHDWKITFVDTGYTACIGERLQMVRPHLEGEEMFLANYSDNVTDFHLPPLIDRMSKEDWVASFVAVRPPHSFHVVSLGENDRVNRIEETAEADLWINGGYFILKQEIFEYMRPGEELVLEPFQRLIEAQRLLGVKYTGFWKNMDTFKDKMELDEMHGRGEAPWQIWKDPKQT